MALLEDTNPNVLFIELAAYKEAVVPFCVVITDHHPPSKNGKYTLALTAGVEESGINLSVANSLYGSGIEPEYEPLINP